MVVSLGRIFAFKKETQVVVATPYPAMDTVRQRYATGEISEEEYLHKNDNLK